LFGPSSRKSRFAHLPRVFARVSLVLLPVVVLVVFLAFHALRQEPATQLPLPAHVAPMAWQESLEQAAMPVANRAIFPYSIVPGGVRDARELQTAVSTDPLVALHYSDFRIAGARAIRLDHPVAMYVSYRRNNRVFWTRNRMVIPAGETLISDGDNLARVRCANRLSPVAVKPVAETEPSKEELSEPSFVPPLMAEWMPGDGFEDLPGTPGTGNTVPPADPPGPTASYTPPPPILPPILLPGAPPIIPLTPGPPLPPVVTPEPGSCSLLVAGTLLIAMLAILSNRRNSSG
jgi:hypothetical protein